MVKEFGGWLQTEWLENVMEILLHSCYYAWNSGLIMLEIVSLLLLIIYNQSFITIYISLIIIWDPDIPIYQL